MKRVVIPFILLLLAGCGHDVPAHVIRVTSNCNGPIRSARFRFEAFDFETNSGSGSSPAAESEQVDGDLVALQLIVTGTEMFGPSRYELTLPPATDALPLRDYIWCGWYVDEDLTPKGSARQDCYSATNGCWAAIAGEQ